MAQVSATEPRPTDAGGFAADRAARLPLLDALTRQLEAEQERWFLWLPVLFGGGIALYFLLPAEPGFLTAPAAGRGGAGAASGRPAQRLRRPRDGRAARPPRSGVAAAKLRTEIVRAPVLERQIGPVDVYGFVELVEPRATKGQRLTIRVTALEKHEARRVARVACASARWPRTAALKPGDAVRLKATLSPPPGPSLPGDYDFARAAWFQGWAAVGFATDRGRDRSRTRASRRLAARSARSSRACARPSAGASPRRCPGETGAIANALITGERGGISEATNQAFRDSGLFHILSISGLHMVIMAGAVFLCIRLALAAIPVHRAALPDQEVGGRRRHGRRARLPADLGRRLRHRALLHHDLHHVPGRAARPAGAGAAQRGAGGAG